MKTKHLVCLILVLVVAAAAQKPRKPRPEQPEPEVIRRAAEALRENWQTPAEKSNYRTTPRYAETMDYVRRVAGVSPRQVKIEIFGRSGEGRDLEAVIVSRDGVFDPGVLHRTGRPIVLIQNAIHAGEMDGKDASLALLRDMVVTRAQAGLLARAVVIFIPIFSADGHERFGAFHRINQNGPEEMGWRTTARNLNLNRDYMKADTVETRALLRLWNRWLPDVFVDNHVTDGLDHQYDTTYALETGPNVTPALAQWQRESLAPYVEKSVTDSGHRIAPYTSFVDPADPAKGMYDGESLPRYSNGYAVLQNRPGMLVEMHTLKDYKTRVTGNYELMRALLEVVNRDAALLTQATRDADTAQIAAGQKYDAGVREPLKLTLTEASRPFPFRGYRVRRTLSEVSGSIRTEYTQEPLEITIPYRSTFEIARSVTPPLAYVVPPQWEEVIGVLAAHGLKMQRTSRPWTAEVETYHCKNPRWQPRPFEGRQILFEPWKGESAEFGTASVECAAVRETMTFPANSVVVTLDQRAARVAIHFLEPQAPDSAVAWGFFNAIFEQKEYGEAYVLEALAREMLAKDAALKEEFEQRVATDQAFASSPTARLNFFYERSPWKDQRQGLYPVGRLTSLEGAPLPVPGR
ncbi:MAG: M14 family metallopeptidase [Acidobacteria bacterium]|nr:M14 family metallopeptidase [Acidobacteriota bacterium]